MNSRSPNWLFLACLYAALTVGCAHRREVVVREPPPPVIVRQPAPPVVVVQPPPPPRIETRTATVSTDITWLQEQHDWPGLAAIGKMQRVRETQGKTTGETAYYTNPPKD